MTLLRCPCQPGDYCRSPGHKVCRCERRPHTGSQGKCRRRAPRSLANFCFHRGAQLEALFSGSFLSSPLRAVTFRSTLFGTFSGCRGGGASALLSKKPLARVSKRVPGAHGKSSLERGGRKVGEGLAQGWRRVGGSPGTLQSFNS